MKVELLHYTKWPNIHEAVKVCQQSKTPEKSIFPALESGHTSLLEHINFTFKIEGISRACSHQLVRHRIASYSQESQRYVKIDGDNWYVVPPGMDYKAYHSLMHIIQETYKDMIDKGIPLEDARYILPNSTKTNLVFSINARSLDNFLTLRTCRRAQHEIRDLAFEILELVSKVCPYFAMTKYPKCNECKEKHKCTLK
jgi:thymidylate synthase (FAD)